MNETKSDWKEKNAELIDFQYNLKMQETNRQLDTLKRLRDAAKDIISKSDIPIYFDMHPDIPALCHAQPNDALVNHLTEKLGINLVPSAFANVKVGMYDTVLIIIGKPVW
jgi:hypothetical protein